MGYGDLEATSISISRRCQSGRGAPRICHVRGAPARPAGRRPFGQGCAQLACSGRAPGSASATHGAATGCGHSGRALASVGGPRGCGCAFGGCSCAVGGCGCGCAVRDCGSAVRDCGIALWGCGCGCGCCDCSLRQRVPWQATCQASPDQQPQPRSRWQASVRSACRTVVTQAWRPSLVWARPRARAQTRLARLRRARVPALQPWQQPAFLLAHPPQEQPRDSAPPQVRQAAEAGARCASRSSSGCNT